MKILILKPSSLGDVVQALPVLRLLKRHQPSHEIYWWVSADLADLLRGDPDLSGIFLFQRRRWASPRHWGELTQSVRRIRAQGFDLVLDLQGLARSGAICWLANASRTIGLDDWREGAPAFYDIAVPRPSPLTHAVDWYLEVLKALAVPRHWNFTWMPERPQTAMHLREKWNPVRARWLVINPGARWPNKRWPVEYFAEVVRQTGHEFPDVRFVILGAQEDAALGAAISKIDPKRCLDVTGQTSLLEMVEWLRLSTLIVTNDTGPMHVAAALGKPVVSMFGPTEPSRTGPYGQIDSVLRFPLPCAPCLQPTCHFEKPIECLRAISPEAVCARLRLLLED